MCRDNFHRHTDVKKENKRHVLLYPVMAGCDVAQSCCVLQGFPPRRRPWPRRTRRRTGSGWRATPSAGRSHGTATRRWSRRGATAARATLGPQGGGAQDTPPLLLDCRLPPPKHSLHSFLVVVSPAAAYLCTVPDPRNQSTGVRC